LLREAIRDSGRVGVAKFILRDTQHLAAVEVIDQALVLTVMRFADELVDTAQFDFPSPKDVRKGELDMAKALVESLAAEWDPSKYTDQYRDNLMRLIQGKVKGKGVALEPATEPRRAEVIDLMERLRRSLAQGAPRKTRGEKAQPAKPRRSAKKATSKRRAPHAA
jgi:DNA end-binding protein Ku